MQDLHIDDASKDSASAQQSSHRKVVVGVIAGAIIVLSAVAFLRTSTSKQLLGFQLSGFGAFAFNKAEQPSLANSLTSDALVSPRGNEVSKEPIASITSPAAGEKWRMGATYKISWNPANSTITPSITSVDISVSPPRPACLDEVPACDVAEFEPFVIATNVPNTGSYSWQIPTSLSLAYQGAQQITLRMNSVNQYTRSEVFNILPATGTLSTPIFLTSTSTTAQYIAAGMGGATAGSQATYNFVSLGGASTISELTFRLDGTANAVASVTVGGNTISVVGNTAYVTGLNLVVPNGGSGLSVPVLLNYSAVGTKGIAPGSTATLILTATKYISGGVSTTQSGLSVSAPTMTLVGSKPAVALSVIPGGPLALGAENKIGSFYIQADIKGNVKINDIKYTVGSSNITNFAISSPRISDGTTIVGSNCVPNGTSILCEFGSSSNSDFDGYAVTAGATKTFDLYGTVTGTAGGGSASVSTTLNAAGFNWDDTSTNGFSGTGLSGSLIYSFTTGSYTIHQ